jgi:aspartate aminotransferase/aromatic-amino-acid transaminase
MFTANRMKDIYNPKGGVFEIIKKSKEAEEKFGKEAIIKSTIGTLLCEDETFFLLDIVRELYRELSDVELFNYATAIDGPADYKEAVKKNTFGNQIKYFSNSHIGIVATMGGTGAIFNTFISSMNNGSIVYFPSEMWDVYKQIAGVAGVKYDTYNLFKNNAFDLENFERKIIETAKVQHKTCVLINDPCQNPTGYCMTYEEWKKVIEILKKAGEYGPVVLINDTAYVDYDFRGSDSAREYLKLFATLPENILVVIAYNISKSLTSYGLRTGAGVAISSSKDVIKEFETNFTLLGRSIWSNIPRGGMALLSKIYSDEKYLNRLDKEREAIKKILKERVDIFITEANKVNLQMFPYKSGFFITLPLKKKIIQNVVDDLQNKNVFVLPVDSGLRIAICSVPIKKSALLPKLLKESIDKFNK